MPPSEQDPAGQDKTPAPGWLISDLVGEPDMLEIIELFVAELPKRAEAIEACLVEGDRAAAACLAHQLKGAAGGYGFQPITDAARTLELALKAAADLEALQPQLRELIDLCNRARSVP